MQSFTHGPLKKRKIDCISSEDDSRSHALNRHPINENDKNDHEISLTTETPTIVKPKRPRTAYNFFFREERAKLLGLTAAEEHNDNQTTRPKKRRHRKSHGKMGFKDMVKYMANRWKELDPKPRAFFYAKAVKDRERYRNEVEAYKKIISKNRRKQSDLQLHADEQKKLLNSFRQSEEIVKKAKVFTETKVTQSKDESKKAQLAIRYDLKNESTSNRTCELLSERLLSVSFLSSQCEPYHVIDKVKTVIVPTNFAVSPKTSVCTTFNNSPQNCPHAPQMPYLGSNYAAIVSAASSVLTRDRYLSLLI
mmetsp:Transcript_39056/g.57459  ORF Transcript_39056/g.57459 Transcript_39056/m.57459 type:complete len:307 (-) Transcript_39056:306-1226(-)|eukprot:CAMPEP_0195523844 /NCGR_PEP_ID=MMETSP0794_2-20130614/23305_1 /TAXON_ID=515487 /ORGANISM="Stephanopyxis turris, Strain CCMP 815" /LENGTH=306 /DNA_ID=CAMNT_0040653929 /DNA_START=45 /DNA_END=965 /DNA_ORIENTATION=+